MSGLRSKFNKLSLAIKRNPALREKVINDFHAAREEYLSIKRDERAKEAANRGGKNDKWYKRTFNFVKKIAKKVAFVQAYQNRNSAKDITKACKKYQQKASRLTKLKQSDLSDAIREFGEYRIKSLRTTVGRFLGLLKDAGQANKIKEYEILKDISIVTKTVKSIDTVDMSPSKVAGNTLAVGLLGTTVAMSTPGVVTTVATAVGTASTGVSIGALHGAVQSQALLAYLGGGSLASGGGGVAAGAAVLSTATIAATGGVAIIAAGLLASAHYETKLTEAIEYSRDVEIAVAKMGKSWVLIDGIIKRTDEMSWVTKELHSKILERLEYLEPLIPDFDPEDEYYLKVFQSCCLLVKAMSELAQTPVVDIDWNLSKESGAIITRTKKILNTEIMNHV